jgi:hypothetical protein
LRIARQDTGDARVLAEQRFSSQVGQCAADEMIVRATGGIP